MDVDKYANAYTKVMKLDLDNILVNKRAKGFSKLMLQNAVEFTGQVENGSWIGMMENPMKKSGQPAFLMKES